MIHYCINTINFYPLISLWLQTQSRKDKQWEESLFPPFNLLLRIYVFSYWGTKFKLTSKCTKCTTLSVKLSTFYLHVYTHVTTIQIKIQKSTAPQKVPSPLACPYLALYWSLPLIWFFTTIHSFASLWTSYQWNQTLFLFCV